MDGRASTAGDLSPGRHRGKSAYVSMYVCMYVCMRGFAGAWQKARQRQGGRRRAYIRGWLYPPSRLRWIGRWRDGGRDCGAVEGRGWEGNCAVLWMWKERRGGERESKAGRT